MAVHSLGITVQQRADHRIAHVVSVAEYCHIALPFREVVYLHHLVGQMVPTVWFPVDLDR